VVAELLGLAAELERCQLVLTGEGAFDATSLMGKVVGSVLDDASARGLPVLVVAGRVEPEAAGAASAMGASMVSLTDRFGPERALGDTLACIEVVVAEYLAHREPA
jgi:glycerate kinase